MRKITIVAILAIALAAIGACQSESKQPKLNVANAPLPSESDSLAYIIGLNIGEQLMKMDSTINYEVVCRAIMDRSGGKAIMSDDEARTQYLRYVLYLNPEKQRQYEEQFLADLAANDREYTRTRTGLTYHIDEIGDESNTGKSGNDWVTLSYTISRVGGEEIYSTSDEQFAISDVHLGLREAVAMLGEGGKMRAWMPSKIAYGEAGDKLRGVKPLETVLYNIEVVKVEKGVASKRRSEAENRNF